MAKLQVILTQDVAGQGRKGDIVSVSDGYAHNFLIKNNKGILATPEELKKIENRKKKEEKRQQEEKVKSEELKKVIEAKKVEIAVKTGENGKLFGAITNKEVAAALEQTFGLKIDRKKIECNIKSLGEHVAVVKLHTDVKAEVKIVKLNSFIGGVKMLDIENLKKVPSSIEAEKSVLGGIFLKPDIFGDVVEILHPNDFYKNGHKLIYEAMRDIYNSGTGIDPIVVVNKLKKNEKFDELVGEQLLFDIISDVPTAANIIEYAKIVKEKATLRRLGEVGTKIVELAYEGYEEVDNILDKAEGMIFKISENVDSKDLVSLKDVIAQEFVRLEKVYQNKGVATGISSGFSDFDQMTSGFHPSDLIILAARPAMGKTAFALNLALNAAMKSKKGVLLFSLEMSSSQLLQRLLSIEAGIGLQKIRNGFLDPDDWGKLGLASMKLSNSEINIADLPNVNVLEIRAIARRLKAAGKLDMIIIDYLQLIKGNSTRGDNRQQEISEISRALKGIARELDIPIIALSQLSRATEQRADRRPMLSDLRESGAIEQDADMVMFLYRDDYYNEDSEDKGLTEVIIGKQRNGPVGTIKLRFFHEYTKFENFTSRIE